MIITNPSFLAGLLSGIVVSLALLGACLMLGGRGA